MAVRKTIESVFVVEGGRSEWLSTCENALRQQGFKSIQVSQKLFQIKASYKKLTTWGEIEIILLPDGPNTKINAKAVANVDNIFALFKSPGQTILDAFKAGIA